MDNRFYFCYICDKRYPNTNELEIHNYKFHPKNQCIFCNKKYKNLNSKISHEEGCKMRRYIGNWIY